MTKNLRNFDEGLSKLEYDYSELFNNQIETIQVYANSDEPLSLEEVLTMGFNYVVLNGTGGYTPDDFSEEELATKVDFYDWEADSDYYRTVYLKEIEK